MTQGKLYPWLEDEHGPLPPMFERRDPQQVARERAEILRAQIEQRRSE